MSRRQTEKAFREEARKRIEGERRIRELGERLRGEREMFTHMSDEVKRLRAVLEEMTESLMQDVRTHWEPRLKDRYSEAWRFQGQVRLAMNVDVSRVRLGTLQNAEAWKRGLIYRLQQDFERHATREFLLLQERD